MLLVEMVVVWMLVAVVVNDLVMMVLALVVAVSGALKMLVVDVTVAAEMVVNI